MNEQRDVWDCVSYRTSVTVSPGNCGCKTFVSKICLNTWWLNEAVSSFTENRVNYFIRDRLCVCYRGEEPYSSQKGMFIWTVLLMTSQLPHAKWSATQQQQQLEVMSLCKKLMCSEYLLLLILITIVLKFTHAIYIIMELQKQCCIPPGVFLCEKWLHSKRHLFNVLLQIVDLSHCWHQLKCTITRLCNSNATCMQCFT